MLGSASLFFIRSKLGSSNLHPRIYQGLSFSRNKITNNIHCGHGRIIHVGKCLCHILSTVDCCTYKLRSLTPNIENIRRKKFNKDAWVLESGAYIVISSTVFRVKLFFFPITRYVGVEREPPKVRSKNLVARENFAQAVYPL